MKAPRGSATGRLAGAPISWGVCEVPGWGRRLPPERVLAEMRGLDLKASELGAIGYLGTSPDEIRGRLEQFSLGAVGGFVPLSLHEAAGREQAERDAEEAARLLEGAGGTYFVTAVVVDMDWSTPFELEDSQWDELADGLAMVDRTCAEHGLRQVLHPHVGTLVETAGHIEEVLARSDVHWCLDTGHFAIGGVDPVNFAVEHAERVELVHLKDVDLSLAPAVLERKMSLLEATQAGMFRPLGQGSVDVAGTVRALEERGYHGWYVFEQDTSLDGPDDESADPAADVRSSIGYLRDALATMAQS